jgi:hypothetical protein
MKTITKEYQVYSFDELDENGKNKALLDQVEFELETMDENSPFYQAVLDNEKNQTPWFTGETIFHDYRDLLIETIKANEYRFLADGSQFNE